MWGRGLHAILSSAAALALSHAPRLAPLMLGWGLDVLDPGSRHRFRARSGRNWGSSAQRARARTLLGMLCAGHSGRRVEELAFLDPVLLQSIREPGPLVWLVPHIGSLDVVMRRIALPGRPVHLAADRPLGPLLWREAVRIRARLGVHVHPPSGSARSLLHALGVGAMVAVAWDGHPGLSGGLPRGITAAVSLARRSGARLGRLVLETSGPGSAPLPMGIRGMELAPAPRSAPEARERAEALWRAEAAALAARRHEWTLNATPQWRSQEGNPACASPS